VGQVAIYSYLVRNSGNVTISGPISIDDDRASDESCPAGDLAPGESLTCSASHTITQADLDDGSVTNVATANGRDPSGQIVTSAPDQETVTAIQRPGLQVLKSASPQTYDTVGQVISYSYLVRNTGNVTVVGPITIFDDVATDESCPANPVGLAPGHSITCSASHTITAADLAPPAP
jgi:uncharacterized repeat protein (TIGR01451 family)